MVTAHELARQLLAGPDLPIELGVADPKDTAIADIGDVTVTIGEIDVDDATERGYTVEPGQCVTLRGWMSTGETVDDDEQY